MSVEGNKANTRRSPSRIGQTVQKIFTGIHNALYRLTGGAFGGRMFNAPVLLLMTTGRKTGKSRTTPLLYLPDGDTMVLVASNGGSDWSPAWWLNLKNNPQARVQVGRRVMPVTAAQAGPEERSRLWPLLVKMYPSYADYQKHTTREIPVIILHSVDR